MWTMAAFPNSDRLFVAVCFLGAHNIRGSITRANNFLRQTLHASIPTLSSKEAFENSNCFACAMEKNDLEVLETHETRIPEEAPACVQSYFVCQFQYFHHHDVHFLHASQEEGSKDICVDDFVTWKCNILNGKLTNPCRPFPISHPSLCTLFAIASTSSVWAMKTIQLRNALVQLFLVSLRVSIDERMAGISTAMLLTSAAMLDAGLYEKLWPGSFPATFQVCHCRNCDANQLACGTVKNRIGFPLHLCKQCSWPKRVTDHDQIMMIQLLNGIPNVALTKTAQTSSASS